MTLTDIISKIILYAKRAIVNDNSSSDAVRITQSGSGNALVVEDSTNPDSTPFVINNTGRVGIGVSSPTESLDVTGNIKASGSAILDNQGALPNSMEFSFRTTGNEVGRLNVYTADGQNSYMAFRTSNGGSVVERMRINDSGNVGIGTTSPSSNLHVDGTVRLDVSTSTTATAGARTLPTNPVDFIIVNINGTNRKIPYYAT